MIRLALLGASALWLAHAPIVAASEPDEADDEPVVTPLTWDPAWPRFTVAEGIVTGVAGIGAAVTAVVPPVGSSWSHVPGIDADGRSALRISSQQGRDIAGGFSDVLAGLSVLYPFAMDDLIVAGWLRESAAVGVQMALIDAEAMAVVALIQGLTKTFSKRERPYVQDCTDDAGGRCSAVDRFRSHFSGHTALAFTGAALTCSHQIHLDLYDDPTAGALTCVAAMSVAGTTGLLRIAADEHHVSDVLVGAAVGVTVGFGLPWLLHYRHGPTISAPEPEDATSLRLSVLPTAGGLIVAGQF